jgi:hypothetical protein
VTPQQPLDKHIPDHDTRYEVTLTGVQLEAMRYLSNWALDVIGAQQLLRIHDPARDPQESEGGAG